MLTFSNGQEGKGLVLASSCFFSAQMTLATLVHKYKMSSTCWCCSNVIMLALSSSLSKVSECYKSHCVKGFFGHVIVNIARDDGGRVWAYIYYPLALSITMHGREDGGCMHC